jgi:Zn finger protein HypA/HybF involved in hydrogenase expression
MRLTTADFIQRARRKHGSRYDYSSTQYTASRIKVIIQCQQHGPFKQTPDAHIQGQGCPKCGKLKGLRKKRSTKEEFLCKASKIHEDYDYEKVKYVNARTPVTITCRKHGDFLKAPNKFLRGYGCPMCRIEAREAISLFSNLPDPRYTFAFSSYQASLFSNKHSSLL